MRAFLLAAAAAGLALGGCAATEGMAPMSVSGDMTPEDGATYTKMAAASDLFEIQSSQLALSKAQSPDVRQFAQMMITHHTQTTQQLMAAARSAGMTPPTPMLMPMQREMMERLQQAEAGPAFDELYLSEQVPAHEMALALHRNYATDGDTAALRTVAAAAVPIVQQHLTRARELD